MEKINYLLKHPGFHRLLAGFFLAAAMTGCSPTVDMRGNMARPEVVTKIKAGEANKERVQELLGTPSTIAAFDKNIWIYIGQRTETYSFFKPIVTERKILAIQFDESARVAQIARYDLKDGKDVSFVDRTTPTSGKELGFLEQLIGNIGRFNTGEEAQQ